MATLPVDDFVQPRVEMSEDELAAILSQHETTAIGYQGADNEITSDQERALLYYNGVMQDVPAQEGSSSVVDRTVALVVDNAVAATLKPFVSSDETVRFAPRGPEDIEIADQATEYVNYVFNNDNPGFMILHDWFKDAFLSKLGTVKVWWESEQRFEGERVDVSGMDEMQLAFVRSQPDYMGEDDGVASIGRFVEDGRVKVQNIPPEEFRISGGARTVEEAIYTAHVPTNVTRSDLIEMGFDAEVVDTLPALAGANDDSTLADARYDDENFHDARIDSFHKSNDRIALRDEYVRVDFDGDGIAELRRVLRVDKVILLNEEADENPFATICPIPMPHKVYGHSLADRVVQEQKIGTVLWRQTLDNLYKSNNPRPIVGEGAHNPDGSTAQSLNDNAPGAAIMVRDIGQFSFSAVPFTADKSFPMMELLDKKVEENSGISRAGQGLDTNALRKAGAMTATEMTLISQGKNARTEMVARIFAETGVSRLFKLILALVSKQQPRERIIRLRGKWVPIDPRGWPELDVSISVGLGIGDKAEQVAQAQIVLQTMQTLAQTPFASLIDAQKVYGAVKRLFTASGIKNTDEFLKEPSEEGQQPAQPSPEEQKAMAELQMQQAKMQFEQQLQAAKLQAQREEAMLKQQLAREEAEFEAELAVEKMNREFELAKRKLEMESALKSESQLSQNRPGGDLDK